MLHCSSRCRRLLKLSRPRHPRPLALVLGTTLLVACSDAPVVSADGAGRPPMRSIQGMSCGASFRMIAYEDDPLMAQHGLPPSTDTVDVCETWTGSDYRVRMRLAGSSENGPHSTDAVQHADYEYGSVTGYDANGSISGEASSVGPTAFDFLYADEATRQASYDDPYYGVYGGSGCLDPSSPGCEQPMASRVGPTSSTARPDSARRFVRHGVTRRGVRALVDAAEEVAPTAEGDRRFRKVKGDEETIFTLDRRTELLVGEEHRGPDGITAARHRWRRDGGGYVRERTEIETTERVGGRDVTSRATVLFQNVRVANP